MLLDVRREKIKTLLLEKKSITVDELSDRFRISEQTIRRDLQWLEEDGFLKRTYGGAVLREKVISTTHNSVLQQLFTESKRRMAKKAAETIEQNDCVFIDNSTTAQYICPEIVDKRITVLSNSINVLSYLSEYKSISLIAIGGNFLYEKRCFVGKTALESLSRYYVDKAFISCNSLSMEKGLSDGSEDTADIRRRVINNAKMVTLMADATKLDRVSFVYIGGFDKVNHLVVDHQLSQEWRQFCQQHNIDFSECIE